MSLPPNEIRVDVETATQQIERIRHSCDLLGHELDRLKVLIAAPAEDEPARTNQRTVFPYVAGIGKWSLSPVGVATNGDPVTYPTQAEAIAAARADLEANGGGELVVMGASGRIRSRVTIGS